MKAAAKAFYRAALLSYEHALSHGGAKNEVDLAQVVLSVDHMADMLMKAAMIESGRSILQKPGHTLGIPKMLAALRPQHAVELEVIHERRNMIQHFSIYANEEEVFETLETGREFASALITDFLGEAVPEMFREPRASAKPAKEARVVSPSERLQRDAAFGEGVLAWAEADPDVPGFPGMRVRTLADASELAWITPETVFEYMPQTDGRHVAAYRQSGGVILYDLQTQSRTVLHEGGGPTDIRNGHIVAQGLGVSGGLGGGVWIMDLDGREEQLAPDGDSARLSDTRIVWQQLVEGKLAIRTREIAGGSIDVLATDAMHPTISANLVAWNGRGVRPSVVLLDLDKGEPQVVAEEGIFPYLRNGLLTYLTHRTEARSFDLVVVECDSMREILREARVPFPHGRGPILTDTEVVWEHVSEREPAKLLARSYRSAP